MNLPSFLEGTREKCPKCQETVTLIGRTDEVGPAGTGKTVLAKQVAEVLGVLVLAGGLLAFCIWSWVALFTATEKIGTVKSVIMMIGWSLSFYAVYWCFWKDHSTDKPWEEL